MNDKYLLYVEKRLYDWADWFSKDRTGLDYRSCSTEYLLMTQAMSGCKSSPGYICSNEEAEEIEELVSELAEFNRNMAIALRCHYFTYGGLRIKAKKLNISHMHYKSYIDMAHQWLVGRLSAHNKMMKNL